MTWDNPLDFKNILTSNADKVKAQPYYVNGETYWDSKDIGLYVDIILQ